MSFAKKDNKKIKGLYPRKIKNEPFHCETR